MIADIVGQMRGVAYGAPDPVLERALRHAVHELCRRSQCWRETLEDTYAQRGVSAYEFTPPYGANVDRVLSVTVAGQRVARQSRPDDLKAMRPATGMPRVFAQHSVRQELLLWPTPGDDEHEQPISILAVLSPTERAIDIPDSLIDDYGQGILSRAKWDVLSSHPEQPWHNPVAAEHHRGVADAIFSRAKRDQHSGHSTLLSVQPRRFI